MTPNELRAIEFLFTANPTGPRDLPDWLLHLIETGDEGSLSPELVTVGVLMFIRREHPGIKAIAARRMISTFMQPDHIDATMERLLAFKMACSFERLRRCGLIADFQIKDIFDLEEDVLVKITEEDRAFFESNPSEEAHREWMKNRYALASAVASSLPKA